MILTVFALTPIVFLLSGKIIPVVSHVYSIYSPDTSPRIVFVFPHFMSDPNCATVRLHPGAVTLVVDILLRGTNPLFDIRI